MRLKPTHKLARPRHQLAEEQVEAYTPSLDRAQTGATGQMTMSAHDSKKSGETPPNSMFTIDTRILNIPLGRRTDSTKSMEQDEISQVSIDESDHESENGALRTLLQFSFSTLSGRDKEIAHLQEAYDRVANGPSEVVFLKGVAGSGKTSIVDFSLRKYASSKGGYFCYGKFDQVMTNVPFSAVVQAYTDLVDLISASISQATEIRKKLNSISVEDLKVISRLISNMPYLTGHDVSDLFDDDLDANSTTVVRLKLIFCALLRELSSTRHPIVLVLDDLQWSDAACHEVIKALLTDMTSRNVLIVCMYRNGESSTFEDLEETEEGKMLKASELSVNNLSSNEVTEMLVDLTKTDADNCKQLSDLIMCKTLGNPYHSMQFLELLARSQMMRLDDDSLVWSWDVGAISAETNVSDNVVSLLERKINDLPSRLRLPLQIAAFLGFSFEVKILEEVLMEVGKGNTCGKAVDCEDLEVHRQRLAKLLDIATNEGLIDAIDAAKNRYKFSHDRVQEALRAMMPEGEVRDVLHVKLGGQLYKIARESMDENILLQAVDHLNIGRGQLKNSKQKVKLANLNLEASKVALSRASLAMARSYAKNGISALSIENTWEDPNLYKLTLDLYSFFAELGESASDAGESIEAVNTILTHAHTELDKMRAYHATMERLLSTSQFEDVLNTGQAVLLSLGSSFPRRASIFSVVYELIQVKKVLNKKPDNFFLELPVIEDENVVHTMRVLNCIALAGYLSGGTFKYDFALATLRNVRVTCQKGLTKYSVFGFAGYALLLSLTGKHDSAYRFGKLAIQIANKLHAKQMEARIGHILYHLVFPWKQELKECIDGFRRSYQLGMASGDTISAFSAAIGAISLMHHTGTPLWETEERLQQLVANTKEYREDEACRNLLPFYQVILNMRHQCDEPSSLIGDAMDMIPDLAVSITDHDHAFKMEIAAQLPLAYYFEDWDKLEYLLPLYDGKHQPVKAHFSFFLSNFAAGMSYFELYRLRNKRHFRKQAKKKLKQMRQWLDGGNVNCRPLATILEAEYLSLSRSLSQDQVLELYTRGATEAADLSLIQFEATAHERASSITGVRDGLAKCIQLYHEWGADAKVSFLERKYKIRLDDILRE